MLLPLCLCAIIPFALGGIPRNSSFWYGNYPVLSPHCADFSPEIPREVSTFFCPGTDILKVYPSLSRTTWFLMEDIEDFSQIVTAEPFYVVHNSENAYTTYTLTDTGDVISRDGATIPNVPRPYGLFGLSNSLIHDALKDIDYEDYIITDSSATIIWVRRENGDLFLTYPTRPDLMGIQPGQIYTLEELMSVLAEAYHNEQ